jgi:GNAT superfamily N-acetyltransferase
VKIRPCAEGDLATVVRVLEERRVFLETLEPDFWRRKPGGSAASTLSYFQSLISRGEGVYLVAETDGEPTGFLFANAVPTPPVYDAGPTAGVDDFYVSRDDLWPTVGMALLEAATTALKARGYAQIIVVSAQGDAAKMAFLGNRRLSLASAWFVGAL